MAQHGSGYGVRLLIFYIIGREATVFLSEALSGCGKWAVDQLSIGLNSVMGIIVGQKKSYTL